MVSLVKGVDQKLQGKYHEAHHASEGHACYSHIKSTFRNMKVSKLKHIHVLSPHSYPPPLKNKPITFYTTNTLDKIFTPLKKENRNYELMTIAESNNDDNDRSQ